jgi:hypothetical protein
MSINIYNTKAYIRKLAVRRSQTNPNKPIMNSAPTTRTRRACRPPNFRKRSPKNPLIINNQLIHTRFLFDNTGVYILSGNGSTFISKKWSGN